MNAEYDEVKGQSLSRLFEWGQEEGIYLNPKLRYPVKFPPGYYGIQTLEDLGPGELLLTAPNNMMFSTKGQEHEVLNRVFQENPEIFTNKSAEYDDSKTMALMLWEQTLGESSYWYNFFSTMPKDAETLVDWNELEQLELQDSSLVTDIATRLGNDIKSNTALRDCLLKYTDIFTPENLEMEKITWNWKILTTRAFGKCTPNGALIPIADFFNHGNVNTNYYYGGDEDPPPDVNAEDNESIGEDADEELLDPSPTITLSFQKVFRINFGAYANPDGELFDQMAKDARAQDAMIFLKSKFYIEIENTVKAREFWDVREAPDKRFRVALGKFQSVPAGGEVKIAYGRYSNRLLLTYYGFAMLENKYNYAVMQIPLKELLSPGQLDNIPENYRTDMIVSYKLKAQYVNLKMIKNVRGLRWNVENHHKSAMFGPSDLSLEEECFEMCETLIQNTLQEYPTTIEEDRELLQHFKSIRHYFAV